MSKENKKYKKEFERGSAEFTHDDLDDLLKNKEKTAYDKAFKHLGDMFGDFKLLWQMLKDYNSGEYTEVPWKFIAATGFAIVYLVSPFDLIPDLIPILGYVDDAAVIGFVFKGFSSDIAKYRMWKEKNRTIE